MEKTRINKLLSEWGVCSRREADAMIEAGRLQVNGRPAEMGQTVSDADVIVLDGKRLRKKSAQPVILAFNKPAGLICTSSRRDGGENIIDFIGYPGHIFPIGRLDKDSSGLILLTDQGELVNRVNRSRYGHEKEYLVSCRKKIGKAFLQAMEAGVEISVPDRIPGGKAGKDEKRTYHKEKTLPCRTRPVSEYSFRIVLTQGLNRQIRRMCKALGNEVTELKRIRIMNIELGQLPSGKWRHVTGEERAELLRQLTK